LDKDQLHHQRHRIIESLFGYNLAPFSADKIVPQLSADKNPNSERRNDSIASAFKLDSAPFLWSAQDLLPADLSRFQVGCNDS
jgi:hypothetical protein